MMSSGQEPYHVEISSAINGVLGGIPGGVLRGDGTLMDKDTINWAPWEPKVGDPQAGLDMIRSVTALRRGPGKDFLVFGRMLRPSVVEGIQPIKWDWNGRKNNTPAVFHSAWQSPDKRIGIVMANWTATRRRLTVTDERLASDKVQVFTSGLSIKKRIVRQKDGLLQLSIPAHSCLLIEEYHG